MAIQKKEYELSIWKEELGDQGNKKETKLYVIGAHDMTCLGRATALKFAKKTNGTQTLTFQMPDRYFDSEKGEYIHNEFVDELFAERKLKLKFDGEWYEFFIKKISESKKHKSFIKTYNCSSAFIDELSRNGYGITFHEDLYNNVEEIGTFSEEILDDSLWHYNNVHNWGDFTEVIEEKLYRIPVSCFGGTINAYKLHYDLKYSNSSNQLKIVNAFTKETRPAEMGDDIAREEYFWDQRTDALNLIKRDFVENIPNDGYIYVPYSCLSFCYGSEEPEEDIPVAYDRAATETAQKYPNKDFLALAPSSVDPRTLIQFLVIPDKEQIEIDESGLIVSKDYTYFLPLQEWNEAITTNYWYYFEDTRLVDAEVLGASDLANATMSHTFRYIKNEGASQIIGTYKEALGNKIVYYEGYLNNIKDNNIIKGKKIQISNRTELNISPEIDQYVTVYRESPTDFENLFLNSEEWEYEDYEDYKYYICSKSDTRQIIPQLARNLIQNGINIKTTDGWEIMSLDTTTHSVLPTLDIRYDYIDVEGSSERRANNSYLHYKTVSGESFGNPYRTLINFGLVGQQKEIEKGKIYCFGITATSSKETNITVKIGTGSLGENGNYIIQNNGISFDTTNFYWNNAVAWRILQDPQYEYPRKCATTSFFILLKSNVNIKNPYIALQLNENCDYIIENVYFFEAFTKGRDQFKDATIYRYSGRTLFGKEVWDAEQEKWTSGTWAAGNNCTYTTVSIRERNPSYNSEKEIIEKLILFEDDVMTGDTYTYQKYFIQRVQLTNNQGEKVYYDTMGAKSYLDTKNINPNGLPQDAAQYTEEDCEVQTNYIDLNQCEYYHPQMDYKTCDCSYGNSSHTCYYQKFGYCPYRFTPEKHCRKVRTLKGEKSNRFNLIQELSKVFKCYPVFNIAHEDNGVVAIENGIPKKEIFFVTEKGMENKLGFRYGQNLSNISRDIDSDKIVTKLYVNDVDSEISQTGLCSIKTAEDNPTKDSFIIDFSYYIKKGMLKEEEVEKDLWGTKGEDNGSIPQGYLKQLGYYNTQYDKISNKIINLQDASYNELQANLTVNLEGIDTSLQQIQKILKRMNNYRGITTDLDDNKAYQNQKIKLSEQRGILKQLIEDTFFTAGKASVDESLYYGRYDAAAIGTVANSPLEWFDLIEDNYTFLKEKWTEDHTYTKGILGQFNTEFKQIQRWKKERASYLKEINNISSAFFKKYEPYLKEGTWSDSNFISDNAYYFGALDVAAEGAIPKVSYNISVIDLAAKPEYSNDYTFNIADTTYIEDIGLFGINSRTGLPNRLKVIISEIEYDLDEPSKNSIKVQDFTTSFEDLFQQVTAAVQSLTYNENIYKRSSNFTSLHSVEKDSLQGTLDSNDLTLLDTDENNIKVDKTGTSGSDINNHANKYKLNGQGLFFSNDGGVHWNVGVGPNGINADYIKVGTLDAGKVRIADSGYIYFAWDRDGIYAYRDPTSGGDTSDYVLYNKMGLSVIENGKLRLRAGYDINTDDADLQGQDVGFYLYDGNGKKIFSTSSGTDESSARMNLTGEIHVSGKGDASETTYSYKYSQLLTAETIHYYELNKIEYYGTPPLPPDPTDVFLTTSTFDHVIYDSVYFFTESGGRKCKYNNNYYSVTERTYLVYKDSSSSTTVYQNYVNSSEIYYRLGNNISKTYAYHVDNSYYKKREIYTPSTPSPTVQGDCQIYLNNTNAEGYNRVFSISFHKSGTNSDNILTVHKNGDLYLGGTYVPPSGSVKDKVTGAGLSYVNRVLKIDFEHVRHTDGSSLIDYISSVSQQTEQQISNRQHRHGLKCTQLDNWHIDQTDLQNELDSIWPSGNDNVKTLILRLNEFLSRFNSDWYILEDTRTDLQGV